jgi:hypothetical protein
VAAPAAAPAQPAGPSAPAAPQADSFQAGSAAARPFTGPAAAASAPDLAEIRKARDSAGLKSTAPKLPPELHNPARASVSVADLRALERTAGGELSVSDLAKAFPNARINGKGATLAEIARKPTGKAGPDGVPLTLGAATIDRNGDLDVSKLYRAEIAKNNQNLIMRKGDEYPVPLEHTIRNSELVVREDSHKKALQAAGFPSKDGALRIDMKDMAQVHKALKTLGLDPGNAAQIDKELKQQGVSAPLSGDDQLRRVLAGKLDSAKNEFDIDDRLVDRVGDHNHEIRPTVYASAKVSPEHLDDVILTYKRFNNQSYAGQGDWATQLLGKDKASQHEGDSEATFIKIHTQTHEVQSLLAARHYYAERYDKKDLEALKQRTGREDLTTSISYKAHGSRLAEMTEKNVDAGHGEDGAKWYDPRDHVFKDQYMGLKDTGPGGKAEFIPKDRINLVLESDDRQSLNLNTRFGATRKGLMGTKILDVFNDGTPADRFGGTEWYYKQEKLNLEGNALDKAARKVADTAKDVGNAVVDTAKDVGRAAAKGYQTAKSTVARFLKKLVDW